MGGYLPGSVGAVPAVLCVFCEELIGGGDVAVAGGLQERGAQTLLHALDGLAKLVEHRLGLQDADVDVLGGGAGDDEGDDGAGALFLAGGGALALQAPVQAREGFDEDVHALVAVLVAAAGEEVEGVVEGGLVGGGGRGPGAMLGLV